MDWFGKSQAVTKEGLPALAYRGEHGELPPGQLFHSRTPSSLTFGDLEAANLYATSPNYLKDVPQAPRVTPGYLKIEKPFVNDPGDPFLDISRIQDEFGTREARRVARKFSGEVMNTGNWFENYDKKFGSVDELLKREPKELRNLYMNAFHYLDDPKEVAKLQARGYDGGIHAGTGATLQDTEYRIFDPAQFRSKFLPAATAAPVGMGALAAQDQYEAAP
jgi:hypothetical protein